MHLTELTATPVQLQVYRHIRLLTSFPKIGPLVLCFTKIVFDDLMRLTPIFVFVVFMFSAAFHMLRSNAVCDPSAENLSEGLDVDLTSATAFGRTYAMLLDAMLSGDPKFECTYESEYPVTGYLLLMFFALLSILVLSMLVAMMTSTFQDVMEGQELNFAFQNAQRVITAEAAAPVMAPLNLLSLPFSLADIVYWLATGKRISIEMHELRRKHAQHAAALLFGDSVRTEAKSSGGGGGGGGSGGGSGGGGGVDEASWHQKWKRANPTPMAVEDVLMYAKLHEDETDESSRWRVRFAQRQRQRHTQVLHEQEKAEVRHNARHQQLLDQVDRLSATVDGLVNGNLACRTAALDTSLMQAVGSGTVQAEAQSAAEGAADGGAAVAAATRLATAISGEAEAAPVLRAMSSRDQTVLPASAVLQTQHAWLASQPDFSADLEEASAPVRPASLEATLLAPRRCISAPTRPGGGNGTPPRSPTPAAGDDGELFEDSCACLGHRMVASEAARVARSGGLQRRPLTSREQDVLADNGTFAARTAALRRRTSAARLGEAAGIGGRGMARLAMHLPMVEGQAELPSDL